MKKTNKKGFTLVELLVVIAIIAILSVVSIVGYTSFTQRAKQSNAKTELAQISTYMYAAAADPESGISVDGGKLKVTVPDSANQTTAFGYAVSVIREAIDDDTAAGRVNLKEAGCESFTSDEDSEPDVIVVNVLYYSYNNGEVVSTWDVAKNEYGIETATTEFVAKVNLPSA